MTERKPAESPQQAPRRSRPAAPRRSRPATLWRDRRFCVFLTSQTLSVAGDSFALIAVPLLILRATGSVAQMGLLTGAAGAAAVVAGIFAGILADRLDRWILMAACDLARMLLYGLIPLGLVGAPGGLAPVRDPAAVRRPRHDLPGRLRHRGPCPVRPGPDHRGQRAALRRLIDGRDRRPVAGRPALRGPRPGCAIAVDAASFAFSAVGVLLFAGVFPCPGREPLIRRCPGATSRMAAPQCHPRRAPRTLQANLAGRAAGGRWWLGPGSSGISLCCGL